MESLKILIYNWLCWLNPEAGGDEVFTRKVAKRWVKHGHEVTLFASEFPSRVKDADTVVGSKCFNLLVKAIFKLRILIYSLALSSLEESVLEEVLPRLLVKRYTFDVELSVNADKRGCRMVEAPIIVRHGEREWMTFREIFRTAIDLLPIFYRLHFTKSYE